MEVKVHTHSFEFKWANFLKQCSLKVDISIYFLTLKPQAVGKAGVPLTRPVIQDMLDATLKAHTERPDKGPGKGKRTIRLDP